MLANLIDGLSIQYMIHGTTGVVVFVFLTLPFYPVSALFHEVGHGIVGALVTKGPMTIHVGLTKAWARPHDLRPRNVVAVACVTAAGPLASFAQGVLFTWLADMAYQGSTSQWLLFACACNGYMLGFLSLVPLEGQGPPSDGQRLLDLWRWVRRGEQAEWIRPG